VVHDQSQSKATFFVEPLEILELNNTLQLSQREAAHEEIRILTELSSCVQQHESAILTNLTILEELDAIHARAALSRAMAAQPTILSNAAAISLKNCRHPILSARFLPADIDHESDQRTEITPGNWVFDKPGVVDIEIIKNPDINTLVITGANAGGKTVALKTLGLFVLMHQAGMHLPASPEGHIAIYESLFADIGDEQNIEASLSTFTAHMERIKAVVNAATPRSLVLLDELGSGTDPSEGGALAVAILEHLSNLGCTTLVTSHLNVLKTYAHTHAGVENVSVEFDPHTHRPLYRLVYGLPGFSNALSIARNIGIPESILQTAGSYIGQADRQVADLVHALEDSQNMLHEKRKQLQALHEQRIDVLNASQRLLETLQIRRDRFLKKFEESARALLHESENRLRSIIKQTRENLRQQPGSHRDTDALKQVQQIKQDLYRYRADKTPAPAPLNHVEPGQKVTIIGLKKTGTVVSVDTIARRAEIDIGSMRVKTGFNELTLAGTPTVKPNKPPLLPATFARPTESSFEKQLNVIGLRVAEALPLIDKCIDTALLQGAGIVEIIHGRGTGRLMRAIHAHLQDHAQVARLIPDSDHPGISSVTRVELK
jgi:DNA mismatch repair protein MutS2